MFEVKIRAAIMRLSEGKELARLVEREQLRSQQAAKVLQNKQKTKEKSYFLWFFRLEAPFTCYFTSIFTVLLPAPPLTSII